MKDIGYYNGKLGALEEMTVPMNDRGCYFGDGIYETVLVSGEHFLDLDRHINRFYRGAEILQMTVPHKKQELKNILMHIARRSEYTVKFLYWQLTRGTAVRTHTFSASKPNLWITVTKASLPEFHKPLKLITVEDLRHQYCHVKSLNLLPNVLAAEKAAQSGCDEAVFIRDGLITECSHSNIHILKGGCLFTAPSDCHILAGIGRENLIQACTRLNIPVVKKAFTLSSLLDADEVLVTSTTKICLSADQINNIPIGGKADADIRRLQSILSTSYTPSENSPLTF